MKKSFLLLPLCFLILGACDKETDISAFDLEEETLNGSWKLVEQQSTAVSLEDEFILMILDQNGGYELLDSNNQRVGFGAYSIVDLPPLKFIEFIPIIPIWTTFEEEEKKLSLSNSSLVLEDPCCAQYSYRFRRQ